MRGIVIFGPSGQLFHCHWTLLDYCYCLYRVEGRGDMLLPRELVTERALPLLNPAERVEPICIVDQAEAAGEPE